MGIIRTQTRKLIERLADCEIERCGYDNSYLVVDKHNRMKAWFSHRAQLRWVLESLEIDLVLDVGANEGQFAHAVRAYYGGEIHSFEPVTAVFEKLAVAASADPAWHVHKLALGSREETQTIHISDNSFLSSLLETNEFCRRRFGEGSQPTRQERVSVRRLDNFLDSLVPHIERRRILLKMDTQGYDMEVFKGSAGKLDQVCAIQSEVSLLSLYEGMPHWTESLSVYEKAGFGVVGMFPVTRDGLRVIEYDCLLARPR